MEKQNNRRPMRQLKHLSFGPGKLKNGKPTMNIILSDIHAFIAYTSPEELKALSRAADKAAAALEREVRGSTLIPITRPDLVAQVNGRRN